VPKTGDFRTARKPLVTVLRVPVGSNTNTVPWFSRPIWVISRYSSSKYSFRWPTVFGFAFWVGFTTTRVG